MALPPNVLAPIWHCAQMPSRSNVCAQMSRTQMPAPKCHVLSQNMFAVAHHSCAHYVLTKFGNFHENKKEHVRTKLCECRLRRNINFLAHHGLHVICKTELGPLTTANSQQFTAFSREHKSILKATNKKIAIYKKIAVAYH